jgi:predicted enzyme related to lactoylglutathione lyase
MTYKPVNTLLWVDIPVLDLDRAIAFYQSLFQLEARDFRPETPTATLQFSGQGSGISLIQTTDIQTGSITPYLNCNSRLDEALAQVKLNGGKVLQDKHSMEPFGFRAVILDSEGNRLALHSS